MSRQQPHSAVLAERETERCPCRFRNKDATENNSDGTGTEGTGEARSSTIRSAAYEKRRMQRKVATKLGMGASGGSADRGGGEEKESPGDIMKKLWTVENLLTVETEWFRYAPTLNSISAGFLYVCCQGPDLLQLEA